MSNNNLTNYYVYTKLINLINKLDKLIIRYNFNPAFDKKDLCNIVMDMFYNPDQRFFDKLKKKVRIELIDYFDLQEINVITFASFYGILMGYKYHKEDFESFDAIVDDLTRIGLKYYDLDFFNKYFILRRECIENIVSRDNYKDNKLLRDFMISCLNANKDEKFSIIKRVFKDISKYKDTKLFDDINVNDIIDEVANYYCNHSYSLQYDEILLFKDRFKFINKRFGEIEKREIFKKEIFDKIRKLDVGFFFELTRDGEKDFFETCMNIVFDSDSYHEIISKLDYLKEACDHGYWGFSAEYIVGMLNDKRHKDTYCGEVVAYPTNCMNISKKPDLIIDRMTDLYEKIDSSMSYDMVMNFAVWASDCINDMYELLEEEIKNEKKTRNKLKNKIKRGVSFVLGGKYE